MFAVAQLGEPVEINASFTLNSVGVIGLSPTVTVVLSSTGLATVTAQPMAAVNATTAPGDYRYVLPGQSVAGGYIIIADAGAGAAVSSRYLTGLAVIGQPWIQATTILGRLGSGDIEFNYDTPIKDGQLIQLVRGNDYAEENGRTLKFEGSTWPDLSAGTTTAWLGLRQKGQPDIIVSATIVEPTTNPKAIWITLTDVVTKQLRVPPVGVAGGTWELLVKIGASQLMTSLRQGPLVVLPQIVI